MKIVSTIAKVLAALAAVAGVVYLVATYGDKIVAWAKKMLGTCCCDCECECDGECTCDGDCECCEEAAVEEAPVEEVEVAEGEPVAEEHEFEA